MEATGRPWPGQSRPDARLSGVNPSTLSPFARRATRVATTLLATGIVLATAGPAGASVPDGWSDPDRVDPVHALLLLGGIPLLIILVVTLFSMGPSLARSGGRSEPDNEWFGGPRRGVAAADDVDPAAIESSESGGARGQW